jgi:hypothetical protein
MENLSKALVWLNENKEDFLRLDPNSHASFTAYEMLKEAEEIFNLESCGIEGWSLDCGKKGVNYLNNGDPYSLTIFAKADFKNIDFSIDSLENVMNSDWFLPME